MKMYTFFLLLIAVAFSSCKEKEPEPMFSIIGKYQAKIYDYSSGSPIEYPIRNHSITIEITSVSDSTVNVEFISTPPVPALPDSVYSPLNSLTYRNVLVKKNPSAGGTTFIVNLSPVFGQQEILENAIMLYGGKKIADYYFTPKQTRHITRTIRLEKEI